MAGERLRVGRDREVRAEVERPLPENCRGRVVDGDEGAGAMRGFGEGGDVADVEPGIRRRFQPQQRGALQQLRLRLPVVGAMRTWTPRSARWPCISRRIV